MVFSLFSSPAMATRLSRTAGELSVRAGGVDLLRAGDELLLGDVRRVADTLDRDVVGLRAVRERAGRLVALLLEGGGELGRLLGHVGQQLHVVELLGSDPIDWLMRQAPRVVAATTGSASSDTRRVEMRQLRRAIREPGPGGPFRLGVVGREPSRRGARTLAAAEF